MNLNELLIKENINLRLDVEKKEEALNYIADLFYRSQRIKDKSEFYLDLIKRESEETTNMDIGVAIPHSHSETILVSSVSIVKLVTPIKWDEDGEDVSYIFLLAASPNDKDLTHLELISKIAELLVDDDFIDFLETNDDPQLLIDKMNEMIGEHE